MRAERAGPIQRGDSRRKINALVLDYKIGCICSMNPEDPTRAACHHATVSEKAEIATKLFERAGRITVTNL